jgi:uncharacterized protein (TIGR02996 family)
MPKRELPPAGRTTLLGLLQAVREEPEADEPRLILADWLEEQPDAADNAHGRLIRVQCQLRGLPPQSAEAVQLRKEEESLRTNWLAAWLRGIPTLKAAPWFERGLVRLTVRPGELFSRAMADWLLTEPSVWVDYLQLLEPSSSRVARLASLPLLDRLNSLDLWSLQNGDGLGDLLSNPRLAHLRRLGLSFDQQGAWHSLDSLASWLPRVTLPRLRLLYLRSCGLIDVAVPVLFDWPSLFQLTDLDLNNNRLGDALALAVARPPVLAGTPPLTGLTRLSLSGTSLSAAGVTALASTPNLAGLRRLDLSHNHLYDGLGDLAVSAHLAGLTHLRLAQTNASERDLQALAASPYLQHIQELDLCGNGSCVALRLRFGDRVKCW